MGNANWGIVNAQTPAIRTAEPPRSEQAKAASDVGLSLEARLPLGVARDSETSAMPRSDFRPAAPDKAAFTIPEACEYSGLSRSYFYTLFDKKDLPRLKAGKRVLILRRDLDDYLLSIREGAKG